MESFWQTILCSKKKKYDEPKRSSYPWNPGCAAVKLIWTKANISHLWHLEALLEHYSRPVMSVTQLCRRNFRNHRNLNIPTVSFFLPSVFWTPFLFQYDSCAFRWQQIQDRNKLKDQQFNLISLQAALLVNSLIHVVVLKELLRFTHPVNTKPSCLDAKILWMSLKSQVVRTV